MSMVEVTSEEVQQMKRTNFLFSPGTNFGPFAAGLCLIPGGKPNTSYSSALLLVHGSSTEWWNWWPWHRLENGREQWIVNIFTRTQGLRPLGCVENKQGSWQKRASWELFKRVLDAYDKKRSHLDMFIFSFHKKATGGTVWAPGYSRTWGQSQLSLTLQDVHGG